MTAGQIRSGCPQRVIRRRNQDLIPVIQKTLHRHRDHLADAVANINIIHTDIRNPLQLAVLHDRLAGTEDSLRIRISFRITQTALHIHNNFFRSLETERSRVSNVQLQNINIVRRHPVCFLYNRSADIIAYMIQFVRLLKKSHNSYVIPLLLGSRSRQASGCP